MVGDLVLLCLGQNRKCISDNNNYRPKNKIFKGFIWKMKFEKICNDIQSPFKIIIQDSDNRLRYSIQKQFSVIVKLKPGQFLQGIWS